MDIIENNYYCVCEDDKCPYYDRGECTARFIDSVCDELYEIIIEEEEE